MANYKMEIFFDVEKVDNDNISIIADKISSVAKQKHFETNYENNVLKINGTGKADDFANIGIIISSLKRKEWFALSVYKWLFYDSENGVEDLYCRYNLGVHKN